MSKHSHDDDPIWDDEAAEWYAEEYGSHFSTTLAVELANLRSSDIVLDIGCGSGNTCRAAATTVKEGQVFGIDPTPAMIRIAMELSKDHPELHRIQFMNGTAEEIPLDSGSVTVAMAINTLYHWDNIDAGFSEVKRILQHQGRFFIADELKEDGTTHGQGPLANPVEIERLLEDAAFCNISRTDHVRGDKGMCFFSSMIT